MEYGLARKVLFASLVAATGWSIKACLSWWSSSKSVNDSDGAIQWEKVGQVGQLLWYPIKSMGPVSVLKLNVTKSGIKSELLKDRILVVTDSLGRVIRVRNYPKIVQIKPTLSQSILILDAPGMRSVKLDLSKWEINTSLTVKEHRVPAQDYGDEISKRLSLYLSSSYVELRLCCVDATFFKQIFEHERIFMNPSSCTLVNSKSIDEISKQSNLTINAAHFNNNIVVTGAKAFEEDNWSLIKIGNCVFKNIWPNIMNQDTIINPESGTRDTQKVLQLLKTFRQEKNPNIKQFVRDSPKVGIHLVLVGADGVIKQGDDVLVCK